MVTLATVPLNSFLAGDRSDQSQGPGGGGMEGCGSLIFERDAHSPWVQDLAHIVVSRDIAVTFLGMLTQNRHH